MHTKDLLASALRSIGCEEMALKAEVGYYDDFLSPLAMPITALLRDLDRLRTDEAMALRRRVMNGEFDATPEESEAWAKSPDGQQVLGKLFGDFTERRS